VVITRPRPRASSPWSNAVRRAVDILNFLGGPGPKDAFAPMLEDGHDVGAVRVDYAFIAEAADSQGGLFYVTRGGADIHFLSRDFPRPLRLGALSFVVRVLGEPHEVGQTFPFMCSIVDADGQVVNFQQQVEARFDPHPIDS